MDAPVQVFVIWVDGSTSYEQLGSNLTFEQLEEVIEGPADCFYLNEGTIFYNEKSKANGLPINELATEIATELKCNLADGEYLYGNVVITGIEDGEGEITSVSKEFAEDITEVSELKIGG